MTSLSFDPVFLDPLLRCDKQQTTHPQTMRFGVGDVAQMYITQNQPLTSKPIRRMTGLGTTLVADRAGDPKYHYDPRCPLAESYALGDIPSYYAHFLGKVRITEVEHVKVGSIWNRNTWAQKDGFQNFEIARCWFESRYGAHWLKRTFTVLRWDGWIERYFEPPESVVGMWGI